MNCQGVSVAKPNWGIFDVVKKYTVNSEYLYKTGANLYDRNRFAPVFISLHSYQASGSSPAGLVTRGAGHPENCGLYHPDVSGSR